MVEGRALSAREEMLGRVRVALGPQAPPPEVPREYSRVGFGPAGSSAVVERFCDRVRAYRAGVVRASPEAVEASIAAACAARGSVRVAAAPGAGWSPGALEIVCDDQGIDARDLDRFDAALTGCAVAIAETGTIVLDGGPLSGRRALTLVPDHHICVVDAAQVVAGLPEAIAALSDAARSGSPVTMISGPSATSDIELKRVEGVHGPRRLDVIVVEATVGA